MKKLSNLLLAAVYIFVWIAGVAAFSVLAAINISSHTPFFSIQFWLTAPIFLAIVLFVPLIQTFIYFRLFAKSTWNKLIVFGLHVLALGVELVTVTSILVCVLSFFGFLPGLRL